MNSALLRYSGRRLLIAVPQLFVITTAIFFLIRILPADPVARIVGLVNTPEAYDQAKQSLGLDRSLPEQYVSFLQGLVHGDLGRSWVSGDPVTSEIAARFPITIQLIVMGFAIALAIAIPLGMISATRPGRRLDRGIFTYGLFAGSQPDFWWGLIFVFVFVVTLGLFPAPIGLLDPGITPPPTITGFSLLDALLAQNYEAFASTFYHYLLPALTMAFVLTGPIIKMVRQNMSRVLESDFMLYANAAGLQPRRVSTYTFRNGLSPVITLVGILVGFQLGGAVLIETVFSLNGLGQYAVERTLQLDYPAIIGIVFVMTGFALVVYLAMDILYAVVDPRIRY